MSDEKQPAKYGAGHAMAMLRMGIHELRAMLYPESNIAQHHNEYGIFGNATPGEVAAERRAEPESPNAARQSILNDVMAQVPERTAERDRSRDMDR